MAEPCFRLRQEVHVVRNHCSSCRELESRMQHPIRVRAIMAYGERFTYRIEDAKGACFNINEACLCSSPSGHSSSPCVFCGQASIDRTRFSLRILKNASGSGLRKSSFGSLVPFSEQFTESSSMSSAERKNDPHSDERRRRARVANKPAAISAV